MHYAGHLVAFCFCLGFGIHLLSVRCPARALVNRDGILISLAYLVLFCCFCSAAAAAHFSSSFCNRHHFNFDSESASRLKRSAWSFVRFFLSASSSSTSPSLILFALARYWALGRVPFLLGFRVHFVFCAVFFACALDLERGLISQASYILFARLPFCATLFCIDI